jgi:hypothetical protein
MPGLVDALPISPSVIISIQQVVGYPPSPHDAALSALAPAKHIPFKPQGHCTTWPSDAWLAQLHPLVSWPPTFL